MRDAARELPYGVHFLRLEQSFLGEFEGALRFAPFGNVPRNLGEADEIPIVVVDRVEDDAGPKA